MSHMTQRTERFLRARRIDALFIGLFSLIYALLSIVCEGYKTSNSFYGVVTRYSSTLGVISHYLLCFIITFLAGFIMFSAWRANQRTQKCDKEQRNISTRLVLAGASIMLILWLPWIIAHYPGTVRDDTLPQLAQWYGYTSYYTQHPVPVTLLFGAFASLGDTLGSRSLGLFLFILVQALVTALTFSFALNYFRYRGAPKYALIAALLFYSLSRNVYQPIDTMSKDAINAPFFILCVVGYIEIVFTRGKMLQDWRSVTGLALSAVLCIATKRTMLYVLILALIPMAINCLLNKISTKRVLLTIIAPIVFASAILVPAINASVNAADSQTFEMYSIPVQQMVRTLREHPDALSADERDRLSEFIDIDRACSVYNPSRSDEAWTCIYPGASFFDCIDIYFKLGMRHPLQYLSATLNMVANWFSVDGSIDYGHDSHEELINEGHMQLWAPLFDSPEAQQEFFEAIDFRHPESLRPLTSTLEFLDSLQRNLYFVSSYGLYCTLIPLLFIL